MILKDDDIVVCFATRSPIGNLQGSLQSLTASQLAAPCIRAAIKHTQLNPEYIDEVIMGCVLSAGQGQAPARQAASHAGIPAHAGATTINKMCGSGMKAVMLAMDSLQLGHSRYVIAGGMESMTNAPYLLPNARNGFRLGHTQCVDHLFLDGLEDAYDRGKLMGVFAENTAEAFNFSREQQDQFALESLRRAKQATDEKLFANEITPITIKTRQIEATIVSDDNPQRLQPEKIPKLRPAFRENGTVTAANSSSISDGAAVLLITTAMQAKTSGLPIVAKLIAHATHAQAPEWFTTAPIGAINSVLKKAQWSLNDVDLFEINEAFAVVTMVAQHELKLSAECVNIYGGACALGHPIGASGARILVTLLNALKQCNLQKGIASLCIGGGEATAIALERFD